MPIKIYTTSKCSACIKAKDLLNKLGKKFTEVDATQNLAEMMDLSGQMSVPVIQVGNHVLSGFNKNKIEALVK